MKNYIKNKSVNTVKKKYQQINLRIINKHVIKNQNDASFVKYHFQLVIIQIMYIPVEVDQEYVMYVRKI